jgi:hypothetical protein
MSAIVEQRTLTILSVLADRIRELTDEVDMYRRNEFRWEQNMDDLKDELAEVKNERDRLQYRIDNDLTQPPTWDDVEKMMQEAQIDNIERIGGDGPLLWQVRIGGEYATNTVLFQAIRAAEYAAHRAAEDKAFHAAQTNQEG